jgi:hypothetical protein
MVAHGGETRQRRQRGAQFLVFRVGKRRPAEHDDRVGVFEWQRPEKRRVERAEKRGVDADADGEGEHSHSGEAGRFGELAEGVAKVGRHGRRGRF